MSEQAVLACQEIYRTFQEGELSVDVLKGATLQINAGERVAIIGSSGSGKSTLLHLLGGLDNPSQGEVHVAGKNIVQMNPAERGKWRNQHLGFVYQFHHLLPEFTALENVCMPLLIRNISIKEAQDKASAMLNDVGLGERMRHKPSELSGGERQRAAVARALVSSPQCVLADEPTGNLDQRTADQVFNRMLELNEATGASLLVVTHDPQLAARMDRTLELVDGTLSP